MTEQKTLTVTQSTQESPAAPRCVVADYAIRNDVDMASGPGSLFRPVTALPSIIYNPDEISLVKKKEWGPLTISPMGLMALVGQMELRNSNDVTIQTATGNATATLAAGWGEANRQSELVGALVIEVTVPRDSTPKAFNLAIAGKFGLARVAAVDHALANDNLEAVADDAASDFASGTITLKPRVTGRPIQLIYVPNTADAGRRVPTPLNLAAAGVLYSDAVSVTGTTTSAPADQELSIRPLTSADELWDPWVDLASKLVFG